MKNHKVGDLVHIPQAVVLLDCGVHDLEEPQLTIPLRVQETVAPTVGVITMTVPAMGYVRVFCDGDYWAVKDDSVYSLW